MTIPTIIGLSVGWASLLGAVVYTAGRLTERIDALRETVRELTAGCTTKHAAVDARLLALDVARARHDGQSNGSPAVAL